MVWNVFSEDLFDIFVGMPVRAKALDIDIRRMLNLRARFPLIGENEFRLDFLAFEGILNPDSETADTGEELCNTKFFHVLKI